ncbi:response regulator [Sphingosinicella sp. LHD-64]|uniref:response regulator n=1 Tax=Sphingosinicella sp. LHD-64 TaxID=3072139 RepID=UPI00280D65DD|nr:response regulator [Sphingosinicella sp. LHD-64]MDQ8757623.1 response regulator [Sphingosinicella sp. LHD-64]
MRKSLYGVLLVMGITGAIGLALVDSFLQPVAIIVAGMLAAGTIMGLALARPLAEALARLLAQPVELLLAQPGILRDVGSEKFNWSRGQALNPAEIEADLALLSREMRRVARQSRDAMLELENAREQANQQNLAKSQFLAKMSHELRTPLNAILGYAMLLQEDATEAGNNSAVADLERIQLAGRNLLTVINDILDLARIEAGKTMLDRGVIDVRALAEAAVAACPADQRNGNSFELTLSEDVGIMIGDASKVRQCLLNLLSNAFKFTRKGSVALSVEPLMRGGAPGISFTVHDTGIGIDAAHLESLFEAFSQVEAGPSRRFGGTGLGLAITRRLARMMGGDCVVESVKGEGSTFRLHLPLSPPGDSQADEGRPTVAALRPLPVRTSERSALIVDDDEAAIDLMQRWLERMGYDVFAALDGETGLELAREHRPNLILLDALLPGCSGYDVLTELRADPEFGLTPVILITVDDDRARGLEAGASDYLRKPLTESQLRAVTQVYRARANGEILVIDDDDDAAELIKRSVEQAGFSTRRANDGLQGIEMASDVRPAAIVLDLAMPGLDGFGVIERLAANETLVDVPLIVVSGCEISLSQHRTLAAAGHRFFTKGASTPREIAESLREMVA